MSAPISIYNTQHDFAFNAMIVDTTIANIIYKCYATPGSASSAPVWSISKTDNTTPNVSITTWANGSAKAINIADNRLGLTYS